MSATPRIPPSPRLAALIGLAYAPIFVALMVSSGVAYPDMSDSTDNVLRMVLIPEIIMAVGMIAVVTWLGWWGPVLKDDRSTHRWISFFPVIWVLALLGATAEQFTALQALDFRFLIATLIATLLVGFCEELVYRGTSVVGLRASRPEWQVWLFSSMMFSLLHGWNAAAGQDWADTLFQMVMTFGIGSTLYACRRATGSLIVCMVFHGLFDFFSLTTGSGIIGLSLPLMFVVFPFTAWHLFSHKSPPAPAQP